MRAAAGVGVIAWLAAAAYGADAATPVAAGEAERRAFDDLAMLYGGGRVDAFFQDLLVLGYYVQKYSDTVQISDVSTNNQPIVIGVRKNDPELVAAFEKGLGQLYKNGTVDEVAKKWGIPAANLLTGTYAK